jgi:hypothetical protein
LNRSRPTAQACSIERNLGGWRWENVGQARLVQRGNELQISVSRKALGLDIARGKLAFNFKWADNIAATGDILNFYTTGDVAPNERFNYAYRE